MAQVASVLDATRVKLPRGPERGVRDIYIDNIRQGRVRQVGNGYVLEGPEDHLPTKRVVAVDALITELLEAGIVTKEGYVPRLPEERTIRDSVRDEVDRRDNDLCQYCLMNGRRIVGIEYDHFIPFSLGGTSDVSNVQLSCEECNRDKWHSHPEVAFGENWEAYAPGKPRPT